MLSFSLKKLKNVEGTTFNMYLTYICLDAQNTIFQNTRLSYIIKLIKKHYIFLYSYRNLQNFSPIQQLTSDS